MWNQRPSAPEQNTLTIQLTVEKAAVTSKVVDRDLLGRHHEDRYPTHISRRRFLLLTIERPEDPDGEPLGRERSKLVKISAIQV